MFDVVVQSFVISLQITDHATEAQEIQEPHNSRVQDPGRGCDQDGPGMYLQTTWIKTSANGIMRPMMMMIIVMGDVIVMG